METKIQQYLPRYKIYYINSELRSSSPFELCAALMPIKYADGQLYYLNLSEGQ